MLSVRVRVVLSQMLLQTSIQTLWVIPTTSSSSLLVTLPVVLSHEMRDADTSVGKGACQTMWCAPKGSGICFSVQCASAVSMELRLVMGVLPPPHMSPDALWCPYRLRWSVTSSYRRVGLHSRSFARQWKSSRSWFMPLFRVTLLP